MLRTFKKILSFILCVAMLLSTYTLFCTDSTSAATLPAEVKGKTISQVLGMNINEYMKWLLSHEDDNYYIGTPYKPYDHRNPKGDCKGAYGSIDTKNVAAMNCTGFVWHVLYKATKSSGGNTRKIPALSDWTNFYYRNNISRKYFSSKSEMLKSGYLDKGDIIWMYKGSESIISDDHHTGIYWGDGKSDVFWHSLGKLGNSRKGKIISPVDPNKSSILYVAIKTGTSDKHQSITNLTLGKGENYKLQYSGLSGCKTSNSKIAKVDSKGKITAKEKGTAVITFKSNKKTVFCKVTVKPAPKSVKLNKKSITVGIGETYILSESTNSGTYANADNLKWESSDKNIAQVIKLSKNKAKIVPKSNGTAIIQIKTYNGKTAKCKVTVKNAPSSVNLNSTDLIMGVGESHIIFENTDSGTYANADNLKWTTSNSKVATVTKGRANKATIAAKGIGTAYIKIKLYNGKTAQCKVNVKKAPSSVKINPASVTLGVGESYTIKEKTNRGTYANADNLKWSSTNKNVATITKGNKNKAQIIAKKVGTAYIKIKLYNGKTAQCKVTVKAEPKSVRLNKDEITLVPGKEFIISESTSSGTYANADNLKWESSDTSIAKITKLSKNKAKITAVGKGTTTVFLRLYNGIIANCTVNVSDEF